MSSAKFFWTFGVVFGCASATTAQQPQTVFPARLPPSAATPKPIPLPAVIPAAATSPVADVAPPVEEADDEALAVAISETMIVTTIGYLNQANLSVGCLADAIGSSAYTEEQAQNLITAHRTLAGQIEGQLAVLVKAPGLDDDDRAAVDDLLEIAKLQSAQCATLQAMFDGDEAMEERWEELRAATLKALEAYAGEDQPATIEDSSPDAK